MIFEIVITVLLSALLQLLLHWFPWQMIFRNGLPRLLAYSFGMLGILLPFSGLMILWQEWSALVALWAVVVASGLAVIKAYGLDWMLNRVRLSFESQEREDADARKHQ